MAMPEGFRVPDGAPTGVLGWAGVCWFAALGRMVVEAGPLRR